MELNIYFEGIDSYQGYQSGIIRKLDQQVHFTHCLMTNKQHDDEDSYDETRVELVNYDICTNCRYEEAYDLNDCLALSRPLVEQMAPYEPMALKMLMRITEFDIFDFEEAKALYLKHLRFWNHMLTTRKINCIVLTGVPHHTHDYVIHCLALVKKIPMCIMTPMSIPYRLFTGTSLSDLWKKTTEQYRNMPEEDVELPADIEHYYQAVQYKNAGMDDGLVHGGKFKKPHHQFHKRHMLSYIAPKAVIHRVWSRWKHGLKLAMKEHDWSQYVEYRRRNREDLRLVRMTRRKLRTMRDLKDYDKMAQMPDYSRPFIAFFLHMQPEATTMPQAGVFVEQYLAVQIMAKALENSGIDLYVKEHFVQPYRSKDFYLTLKEIRGVKLIKSTVDSKELLKRCLASSTCTGTIIIESMMNGKPALVFGDGGAEYGPGLYKINSVETCKEAIAKIQELGFSVDRVAVRRYFKAFAEQSVYAYINPQMAEKNPALTLEQSQDHIVEWVSGFIRSLKSVSLTDDSAAD